MPCLRCGTTDLGKAVAAEESLVIIFGEECRGKAMAGLIAWGLKRGNVRFALLGDHSNSRGAADMGVSPDLLPGYVPVTAPAGFAEYAGMPAKPGKTLKEMVAGAEKGALGATACCRGQSAVKAGCEDRPRTHSWWFRICSLPRRRSWQMWCCRRRVLYEKSGTVTNTYGDVQMVKKAADRAGVKPDFEILVRLADAMGADVKALVPFGKGGVTADLGQTRGAQAGEADRHAVWLAANNLEPRLSPFDPLAVLDEIARLVPGYRIGPGESVWRKCCCKRFGCGAGFCAGVCADGDAGARHIVHIGNAGAV